jgi:hypothetical protein
MRKTPNEEWPQKGAKNMPKYDLSFFAPFVPFCGQMPSSFDDKAAQIFGLECRMTMWSRERV